MQCSIPSCLTQKKTRTSIINKAQVVPNNISVILLTLNSKNEKKRQACCKMQQGKSPALMQFAAEPPSGASPGQDQGFSRLSGQKNRCKLQQLHGRQVAGFC
jgi:hypothetical protein